MNLSEKQFKKYEDTLFLKSNYNKNNNESLYALHENYKKYILDFSKNNINFLNEAYYGKNEILKRIEGYYDEFRNALKTGDNPNKLSCMRNFKNDICELFNVADISYTIIPSNSINSMTVQLLYGNVNNISKENFELSKNKYGLCFKDSKNKKLVITVYSQLILKCTSAECVAVLLHEIGHNFFLTENYYKATKLKLVIDEIMNTLPIIISYLMPIKVKNGWLIPGKRNKQIVLLIILKMMFDIVGIIRGKVQDNYSLKWSKLANNDKKFKKLKPDDTGKENKFKVIFKKICQILGIPVYTLAFVFQLVLMLPITLLIKILNSIVNLSDHGYSNEKFADNFAVSYGYGEETAKLFSTSGAFGKIDTKDATVLKNPLFKHLYLTAQAALYLVTYITDPHPANHERVKKVISKLEYELTNNKDLTKEQQDDIKKQIELTKKIRDTDSENMYKVVDVLFYKTKIIDAKDEVAQKLDLTDEELFDFENKLLKKLMKE